ncbi:hypothetical protein GSI_15516 [Ganoderma sinense ZZ0214-1]|uniref:DUF6534 domain-containing protein n=1 Tax=Ganoderma sinense ZZ0214-1 TaxID=1077348 RepID=A0A2G8RMU9_9APHY|nr:hypothetical protein GSI_15516 [Ganoderma sinense ZZ0214-1]
MTSAAQPVYGPIFIGLVFNIMLYGMMITQTYLYFNIYSRGTSDRLWIKLLVGALFVCDTLNTGFDIGFVYDPLVNRFGDVDAVTRATWVFATDPAMTSIIAVFTQFFFAWRVKVLTGNYFAVCCIMFSAFAQFCGGVGTSIAVGMIPEFAQFTKFKVIVIIWLAFSAVSDVLITASLVWHLRKNKTGMSITDHLIDRIIRMTVQTGLLTAVCAVINLILFLLVPSGWHLLFNLPLSKLYTNSLLSSLNSRRGWKYDTSDVVSASHHHPEHPGSGQRARNVQVNVLRSETGRRTIPQQIYIDVESHEMVDVADVKGNHYPSPSSFLPDTKAMSTISEGPMSDSRGSEISV